MYNTARALVEPRFRAGEAVALAARAFAGPELLAPARRARVADRPKAEDKRRKRAEEVSDREQKQQKKQQRERDARKVAACAVDDQILSRDLAARRPSAATIAAVDSADSKDAVVKQELREQSPSNVAAASAASNDAVDANRALPAPQPPPSQPRLSQQQQSSSIEAKEPAQKAGAKGKQWRWVRKDKQPAVEDAPVVAAAGQPAATDSPQHANDAKLPDSAAELQSVQQAQADSRDAQMEQLGKQLATPRQQLAESAKLLVVQKQQLFMRDKAFADREIQLAAQEEQLVELRSQVTARAEAAARSGGRSCSDDAVQTRLE